MSKKTFALEKKLSKFLDEKVYPANKYVVKCLIVGKEKQRLYGDKILISLDRPAIQIPTEEKAASYIHENMVNELIQDINTKSWGWFVYLLKAQLMMYGYYENKESEIPAIVYKIQWQKHREYLLEKMKQKDKRISYGITAVNFGLTLNAYYPWADLINQKIATVIYNKEIAENNDLKKVEDWYDETYGKLSIEGNF